MTVEAIDGVSRSCFANACREILFRGFIEVKVLAFLLLLSQLEQLPRDSWEILPAKLLEVSQAILQADCGFLVYIRNELSDSIYLT